ncbi:MAG: hypothetical protein K1X89_18435 [Myxococcaceae bacterium]|nr:hypothetical protein [Myxococcaceae bacterium]
MRAAVLQPGRLTAPGRWSTTLTLPFDAVRSAGLRALGPRAAFLWRDRERRVALLGAAQLTLAAAATLLAPVWLLTWSPLVLGVPHLLADVRYLVLQPGLHRARRVRWVGGSLLAVAAVLPGVPAAAALALALAWCTRAALSWKLAVTAACGAAAALAFRYELASQLALVHGHNLVALWLWWRLRPRGLRSAVVPLTALLGLAVVVALAPLVPAWGLASVGSTSLDALATQYAPDLAPALAQRVLLAFCFLQAVHYAAWLRLIPEDARERAAPRPFRASLAALLADVPAPALAAVLLIGVGLAGWGLLDTAGARLGYLTLAGFHGALELGVLTYFALQERAC